MFPTVINAKTIPDAWFQVIWAIMRGSKGAGDTHVNTYKIDKGSYVGQRRWEFDFLLCTIDFPGKRPMIPDIPDGLAIPPPVESEGYIEDYFVNYLMNPQRKPNETYRYSSWVAPGVERVIEQLRGSPGNNQATISVGSWAPMGSPGVRFGVVSVNGVEGEGCLDTDNLIDPATEQRDPACLRVLDFRLGTDNVLHLFCYFRSWDLWGGFPANLGGLQLLNEYVAQQIEATPGRIVAASKGAHLYDHAIDVAAKRVGMTDVATMEDLLAEWGRPGL